jgi:ribosome-associated heat shock protein Hsp15
LSGGDRKSTPSSRRVDQWLWFARLVKSRSLAAKLCAAGAITLNGVAIGKSNHIVRVGDELTAVQGAYLRTVRVLALGSRRGPAGEARLLYEEIALPIHRSELAPKWEPLLAEGDPED